MLRSFRRFTSFSHIDSVMLTPKMVNIAEKSISKRKAKAKCQVILPKEVLDELENDKSNPLDITTLKSKKGPILATCK